MQLPGLHVGRPGTVDPAAARSVAVTERLKHCVDLPGHIEKAGTHRVLSVDDNEISQTLMQQMAPPCRPTRPALSSLLWPVC